MQIQVWKSSGDRVHVRFMQFCASAQFQFTNGQVLINVEAENKKRHLNNMARFIRGQPSLPLIGMQACNTAKKKKLELENRFISLKSDIKGGQKQHVEKEIPTAVNIVGVDNWSSTE